LITCASRFPRARRTHRGGRLAGFEIRLAELADSPDIERLIARSVRELCSADYSGAQLEAALGNVFGVDSQLIDDQTYFVVAQGRELAAAGGWSFRRTLFGADGRPDRSPEALDPTREPAKIRAFFVAPEFARRGIGRALLERCEQAARSHGFRVAELAATLTGERLYASLGYQPVRRFSHALGGGLLIDFVSMQKPLA
jgi:GNAT superfamily N-acetyltransferase